MLEGLCAAHPGQYRQLPGHPRVALRAAPPRPGKVGIVTGGGSGHLPMFVGCVGPGPLDACAVGNVFAGQTVADAEAAMRAVSAGAGVLQLYGNYGGDKMNFNLAAEAAGLPAPGLAASLGNLLPVIVGNLVGGSVLVVGVYWVVYRRGVHRSW